jgi:hypothetical protein
VQAWPIPKTITEMRRFLGLARYYRQFIRHYDKICRPLFETLKKCEFYWGPDQLVAFETIKKALCSAPVLVVPNFTKPFILECDASEKSIGAFPM